MFVDSGVEVVSINSSWQKNRNVTSSGAQTQPLITASQEIQSYDNFSVATQTKGKEEKLEFVETDNRKLEEFLRRVEPTISSALRQNLKSTAFDTYAGFLDNLDATITNSHALRHQDIPAEMQCSALDWNSSGTTVAVGYGLSQHEDWCTHRGAICTWNVERRSVDPKKADVAFDTETCVTSVAFSPDHPALLAAGTVSGVVYVWNLGQDGDKLAGISEAKDQGHKDIVSAISWLNPIGKDPELVTAGKDGKILVWSLPVRGNQLQIQRSFVVLVGSLPRSLRGANTSNLEKETGVSSLGFNRFDPQNFMIGTETGGVCHCSLNSNEPVSSYIGVSDIPIYSPIVLALKPHRGPVHSVKASSFQRSLFATSSADGSVRLYNFMKLEPLVSVDLGAGYNGAISWSPVKPLTFAVSTATGKVAIMDLGVSELSPAHWIDVAESNCPIFAVNFNPQRPDTLATGDAHGVVKIWQLGEKFFHAGANEHKLLDAIAARSDD